MEMESTLVKPPEAHKPVFGKSPETFNPIDMRMPVGKLIVAVFQPKMFLVSPVHQTIVTTPFIRMDNALKLYTATNNRLTCRL